MALPRPTAMAHVRRLLAGLPLLAVAACGPASPSDDDALSSAPYPPDALVAQVARTGGFLPVGADFRSMPSVSMYGDGRVITEGAQIAVFPGPALPSVHVGELEPAQVRRLVTDGHAVLSSAKDYGQPPVADAPTTVVVVGAGEQREVARAVALEEAGGEPAPAGDALTPDQREARGRLRAYVRRLEAAATEVTAEPYEAQAMAVLAMPYGEQGQADLPPPQEMDWPGPPLDQGEPSGPGRCLVVEGDQLDAVRAAAEQASQETAWKAGGQLWQLAFRPLLPHEQDCGDVLGSPPPA